MTGVDQVSAGQEKMRCRKKQSANTRSIIPQQKPKTEDRRDDSWHIRRAPQDRFSTDTTDLSVV